MIYKFYDTCSLLKLADKPETLSNAVISSITLQELEHIKTSSNKDEDVKYRARQITHILEDNYGSYEIILYNPKFDKSIIKKNIEITNDSKIIACADHFKNKHPNDKTIFVTNDLCCKHIARLFFGDNVESIQEDEDDGYTGYKDIYLDSDKMAQFYQNPSENVYNLNINQYLIVHDKSNENKVVDTLCYTGKEYRHLNYKTFTSKWFGDVKPIKNDIYQAIAADSLLNNKITMIKGPAGTGKTFLSLGYLLHLLDRNRIDKIIIFCNTVATRNSAKLGYYPGTRDEKLLDSQIGNLLISKIGARVEVERMIEEEKIILLPLSDIRGYDTSGARAGIYISEAQNLDIDLMKLTLQRIGEDSICIIDGDCKTQVDDAHFAGANNGMRRASKIFRGEDVYGEVTLQNIHRSKIACIAEKM